MILENLLLYPTLQEDFLLTLTPEQESMEEKKIPPVSVTTNWRDFNTSFACPYCGETYNSKEGQHKHTVFCHENLNSQETFPQNKEMRQSLSEQFSQTVT